MVGISALLFAYGAGVNFYGFSTFFLPLSTEFGWSRAQISLVFALARLEGGIEGPAVGWLVDRFGGRMFVVGGLILFGVGFMWMSKIQSFLAFALVYILVLSLGYLTACSHTLFAVVTRWFVDKRSTAMGIVTAGIGAGGAAFVPLLAWSIGRYGWRPVAMWAGIGALVLAVPAALFIRSKPEDKGLAPDGKAVVKAEDLVVAEATNPKEKDFTLKEALKTSSFWLVGVAQTLYQFVVAAIAVHLIPSLVDKGISQSAAAGALGLLVAVSIPSRLIFGWLGDRFAKRYLLLACCFIETAALVIVLFANTIGQAYLFVAVFALGYGVIPLNTAIIGEYWGSKNFAVIRGVLNLVTMAGIVSGPVFSGWIYDVSGNYQIAFYSFMVCYFLAGVVFFLAKPPKEQFGAIGRRPARSSTRV